MSILLLIIGLILFIGLVVVHEFGHFIMARRSGVEVEEFGIGFPPRAWGKRLKSGMLLSINWLPLGGFVRLKGEHDADTDPGTYGRASLLAKSKIMVAGVVMNLATAYVILVLLALVGLPKLVDNQFTVANDTTVVRNDLYIGYVEPGSPAEQAGLKTTDRIVAYSQNDCTKQGCLSIPHYTTLKSAEALPDTMRRLAGEKITIQYQRQGEDRYADVKLRPAEEVEVSKNTDNPKGYLGVVPTEYTLLRSTWSAPIVAAGLIKQFTVLTFQGLGNALGGLLSGNTARASQQVSGPVGIYVILKDGSLLGVEFILMIIAIISLTLAIMNVLPIPALDGGRLFVTWLFRVIKQPLTQRKEELIHGSGFALLMVLFVLITIVDVKRNF